VFSTLVAALVLSLTIASALFYRLSAKKKEYHKDEEHERTLAEEEKVFLANERKGKKAVSSDTYTYREKLLQKLTNKYSKTLNRFLHRRSSRILTIVLPFILMILTFVFLSPSIGFTLFPSQDSGIINITVQAKTGTDEDTLMPYISQVESAITPYPELKVYYITISGDTMSVNVELLDDNIRKAKKMKDVFTVEDEIMEKLKPLESQGLKVEVASQAGGPST